MMRGAVAGAYAGLPPAIRPAGIWDLIPGGHRILGMNIDGRDDSLKSTGQWLGDFWYVWEWSTWLKPQIDQAKTLGANTIKVIGTQAGRAGSGSPYASTLDTATYLARWAQLLDYCRAQGLYAYPCLGSDSNVNDFGGYTYTPTAAWLAAEYALITRFLRRYRDIIPGIDLAVESITWAATGSNAQTVYRAVKTEAPELKFTWSKDYHSAPVAPTDARVPPAGTYDFLEPHIYYDAAPGDFDRMMTDYNVPVVVGEFGQNIGAGTTARQSRYNAVKAVVNTITSGRQLAGAMAWNARDQSTSTADQWGIADASGNVRADVSSIFSSFPS